MSTLAAVKMLLVAEAGWAAVLLLFLAGAMVSRSAARRRRAALPGIRAAALDALTVYLGGNRDLTRLKAIAAAQPLVMEKAILDLQFLVGGRREELCDLAIQLNYVQGWCRNVHSGSAEARREALSHLAAMTHYQPVRRMMGNMATPAFAHPDEETRLQAARILLCAEDGGQIAMVFECALADSPRIRLLTAPEFGRHAADLCRNVVPNALKSREAHYLVKLLRMLTSWERCLPLMDVGEPAGHPNPAVRLEVMRLLPFLPTTPENLRALRAGLADKNPGVSDAARTAAERLKLSDLAPDEDAIETACAGGTAPC